MSKNVLYIGVIGLVLLIGAAVYVLRPPAEPSVATAASEATQAPAAATLAPVETAEGSPAAETNEVVVYSIVSAESSVSFAVNEVLRGDPYTAIGRTNQVTGELSVNFDEASAALSVIQVNARTLKTDSSMRDRMIANEILDTSEYEFITFAPTQISGLPASAEIGAEIHLTIQGDLTIRNLTKPVTFEAVVKLTSLARLEGRAEATVLRSDYGINIPEVPSVAGVEDEVLLTIVFVAEAQQ